MNYRSQSFRSAAVMVLIPLWAGGLGSLPQSTVHGPGDSCPQVSFPQRASAPWAGVMGLPQKNPQKAALPSASKTWSWTQRKPQTPPHGACPLHPPSPGKGSSSGDPEDKPNAKEFCV